MFSKNIQSKSYDFEWEYPTAYFIEYKYSQNDPVISYRTNITWVNMILDYLFFPNNKLYVHCSIATGAANNVIPKGINE